MSGAAQPRAWWGSGGLVRRKAVPQFAWILLALVAGFLVLWPVVQLQLRAFVDGGSAFARMMDLPRIGSTMQTTLVLAVLSSALAVFSGTLLAWCASTGRFLFHKDTCCVTGPIKDKLAAIKALGPATSFSFYNANVATLRFSLQAGGQ